MLLQFSQFFLFALLHQVPPFPPAMPSLSSCLWVLHIRSLATRPALAPMAPAASPASCHAAWSCSPGPRFAAGVCLLRTRRTEGRGCLHGEGGWSSGGPRSRRSQSLLAEFRPDFREWKLPGPSLPPGGRVGQFEPGQDS